MVILSATKGEFVDDDSHLQCQSGTAKLCGCTMLIWNIGKKEQVKSILDINEPIMSEPWKCYKCIQVGPSTVLSSTPCGLDWERMNPDMQCIERV